MRTEQEIRREMYRLGDAVNRGNRDAELIYGALRFVLGEANSPYDEYIAGRSY
jgi:hypothetical protein